MRVVVFRPDHEGTATAGNNVVNAKVGLGSDPTTRGRRRGKQCLLKDIYLVAFRPDHEGTAMYSGYRIQFLLLQFRPDHEGTATVEAVLWVGREHFVPTRP
jgi:hypothetical protein